MMGKITVDTGRFAGAHEALLESEHPALWTFSIQNQNICFWGSFSQAAYTARLYAEKRGMTHGAITVLDCAGPLAAKTVN